MYLKNEADRIVATSLAYNAIKSLGKEDRTDCIFNETDQRELEMMKD